MSQKPDAHTLIGTKVGQTTFFEESGAATHVTVLEVGPCVVIQKKTVTKEGYEALQLGFAERGEKHTNKALAGHFKKSGATPKKELREVRLKDTASYQVGQSLTVDLLQGVHYVDVTGVSKGKGYQGVVRRHGFKGGAGSHGSMFHRAPGGIGASSDPSRVLPGNRMPGHMGVQQTTVLNLRVVKVDGERNLLFVEGAVPGANGGIITVRPSLQGKQPPQVQVKVVVEDKKAAKKEKAKK
jgi:large subunit ribosomal protein L3